MAILGMFLQSVAAILDMVLSCFMFLFFARAILSWVNPDPSNVIVQFLYSSTEPVLYRIRQRIPPLGMLDLSVLVAILILVFLQRFVVGVLMYYGTKLV